MSSTPFERPFVLPPASVRAERRSGAWPLAGAFTVIAFADLAPPSRATLLLAVLGLAVVWLVTLRAPGEPAR